MLDGVIAQIILIDSSSFRLLIATALCRIARPIIARGKFQGLLNHVPTKHCISLCMKGGEVFVHARIVLEVLAGCQARAQHSQRAKALLARDPGPAAEPSAEPLFNIGAVAARGRRALVHFLRAVPWNIYHANVPFKIIGAGRRSSILWVGGRGRRAWKQHVAAAAAVLVAKNRGRCRGLRLSRFSRARI